MGTTHWEYANDPKGAIFGSLQVAVFDGWNDDEASKIWAPYFQASLYIPTCQVRVVRMFVRYVWAFRTRVLKTRVPERTFWVNPFFQWFSVNLFPGFEQRNPFPPLKKDVELLWAQSCVWSHKKVDLPNSGSFLGEATKVLASPGLWGKLGFLPGSFFSLKEKGSDQTLNIFWKILCDTADPFCREQKKDSEASGIHKTTKNTLAFGTRVPERTFCVLRCERAKIIVRFYHSCSPPPSPPPPPRLAILLLLLLLLRQHLLHHLCLHFHVRAQCAPLDLNLGPSQLSGHMDLNLGPSQLSGHRWTSTWDLPSSVCTAGPQRPDRMPEDMPDRVPGQIEC